MGSMFSQVFSNPGDLSKIPAGNLQLTNVVRRLQLLYSALATLTVVCNMAVVYVITVMAWALSSLTLDHRFLYENHSSPKDFLRKEFEIEYTAIGSTLVIGEISLLLSLTVRAWLESGLNRNDVPKAVLMSSMFGITASLMQWFSEHHWDTYKSKGAFGYVFRFLELLLFKNAKNTGVFGAQDASDELRLEKDIQLVNRQLNIGDFIHSALSVLLVAGPHVLVGYYVLSAL